MSDTLDPPTVTIDPASLDENEYREKNAGKLIGGGPGKYMKREATLRKNHPGILAAEDKVSCPVTGCKMPPTRYPNSLIRHFKDIHPDLDKDMALGGILSPDDLDK